VQRGPDGFSPYGAARRTQHARSAVGRSRDGTETPVAERELAGSWRSRARDESDRGADPRQSVSIDDPRSRQTDWDAAADDYAVADLVALRAIGVWAGALRGNEQPRRALCEPGRRLEVSCGRRRNARMVEPLPVSADDAREHNRTGTVPR